MICTGAGEFGRLTAIVDGEMYQVVLRCKHSIELYSDLEYEVDSLDVLYRAVSRRDCVILCTALCTSYARFQRHNTRWSAKCSFVLYLT